MTRRSFGGMAFAGAFAAALKPLRGAAAESPCRLRLGVLSDIHVPSMEEGGHFRKALKWFDSQKVDGVAISGDLGFKGLVSELKCVADIWYEVFPNDRRSDGGHVEKLFVTGNHDVDGYFYHHPEFPKVKFPVDEESAKESFVCNRERVWEELFHETYETVKVKEVKGYKFVLFHWFAHLASDICSERWTAEPPDTPFYNALRYEHRKLDEFFATRGAELKGDKPFFYFQHPHPKNTCYGTWAWGSDNGSATKNLSAYSNAVAFSGHSHYSLTDERSIWQGAFTSLGTSSLRYTGFTAMSEPQGYENGSSRQREKYDPYKIMRKFSTYDGRQGMLVSVYDDRIVFARREFVYNTSLGEDWVLPLPAAESKPWAHAASQAAHLCG